VEREAEGIDDRALARAGRPDEREEVDVGEVNVRLGPVRAKAVQEQSQRSHRTSLADATDIRADTDGAEPLPSKRF
jgi:hypothetical protein